jgi:hypothetical protein
MRVTYRPRPRTNLSTAYALRGERTKDHAMKFRQTLLSLTAFALVVGGLAWVDPRVRDWFAKLIWGGDGISSWDNRVMDFGGTMLASIRISGLENGPLLVFAVVGAVLFVFMVRT